ncbi:hypothetical protein J4410_05240 [Candidatus Woesearchaeota archaeon]|nr:hypothetical protein [Candidatus Woesearchaeota archaeon]
MEFIYQGKSLIPTKIAVQELSEIDSTLYDVVEILEKGFPIRKRAKSIIERGMQKGNKIVNVVIVDVGNYYKLIHAGQFTASRKFKKLMKNEL